MQIDAAFIHGTNSAGVPARVESLFILEDLTCLQLLLIHSFPLLCELAPVFLALNTQEKRLASAKYYSSCAS